jgi:hypothetical protein
MWEAGFGLPGMLLLGTWVNTGLLVCLLALLGPIRTQPYRDVRRLHRPPNHPYEILAQGIQIRIVSKLS